MKKLGVVMTRTMLAIGLLVLGLLAGAGLAQEIVTLGTPQVQTATTCSLNYFAIDPSLGALSQGRIILELKMNTGAITTVVYGPTGIIVNGVQGAATPTGASRISALNKANFSGGNPSMINAIYSRLNTDGVCVGTVSGSPQ